MSDSSQVASQSLEAGVQKAAACTAGPCPACQAAMTAGAKFCPSAAENWLARIPIPKLKQGFSRRNLLPLQYQ